MVRDGDIYVIFVGGRHLRVTAGANINRSPGLSPDRSRVAYSGADNYIHVVSFDGTGDRTLAASHDCDPPVWSPDGEHIACVGERSISIINIGTDFIERTIPTSYQEFRVAPSWSNDGNRIVYDWVGDEGLGIYTFEVHSGLLQWIATSKRTPCWDAGLHSQGFSAPVFSPDGSRIAFMSGEDIMVVNSDGSDARVVVKGCWPAWSPDGTEIAFVRTLDDKSALPISGERTNRADVYVVNLSTDKVFSISSGIASKCGGVRFRPPSWSPNSRDVAFSWCRDLSTDPFGLPESESVALMGSRSDGGGAYVIERLSYKPRRYPLDLDGLEWPTWLEN